MHELLAAMDQLESMHPDSLPLPLHSTFVPKQHQPFSCVREQQGGTPAKSSRPWPMPRPSPQAPLRCPRCSSYNTRFSYYNNYKLDQPRHICKTCRRCWTVGGAIRDVPVGGSRRNWIQGPAAFDMPSGVPQVVDAVSSKPALVSSSSSSSRSAMLREQLPTPPTARPEERGQAPVAEKQTPLPCPRCNSYNTKFSYYNNYSMHQPRYYCNTCRRCWTKGGSLRTVPIGRCIRKPRRKTGPVANPTIPSCKPLIGALSEFGSGAGLCLGASNIVTSAPMQHEAFAQFKGIVSTSTEVHGGRTGDSMLSLLLGLDVKGYEDGTHVIPRSGMNSTGAVVAMGLQSPQPSTVRGQPPMDSNNQLRSGPTGQPGEMSGLGLNLLSPAAPTSTASYYMDHLNVMVSVGAAGRGGQHNEGASHGGMPSLLRTMELTSLPPHTSSSSAAQPSDGEVGIELQIGSPVAGQSMHHMITGAVPLPYWWPGMHARDE